MTISPEQRRAPRFGLEHRLALSRDISGLKQVEMGDVLGTSHGTVSNFEKGKTRPSKLQINAWAVATGVDVEWLKTGETPPEAPRDGSERPPLDYKAQVSSITTHRKTRPANRTDTTRPRAA